MLVYLQSNFGFRPPKVTWRNVYITRWTWQSQGEWLAIEGKLRQTQWANFTH